MNTSEILIYQAADGKIIIDVRLEDETVWLTQDHMAGLFGKSKKTISEHIRNIFSEGELDEQVVVRNFRTTTRHGAMPERCRHLTACGLPKNRSLGGDGMTPSAYTEDTLVQQTTAEYLEPELGWEPMNAQQNMIAAA
jgi:hypothetical protein